MYKITQNSEYIQFFTNATWNTQLKGPVDLLCYICNLLYLNSNFVILSVANLL